MDLARPSEVLVSGTVRDLVIGSPFGFMDRGRHELKGVPGMWQLYAVTEPETLVEIDLREPRELTSGDRMSLYLARNVPGALRSLAGMAVRGRG